VFFRFKQIHLDGGEVLSQSFPFHPIDYEVFHARASWLRWTATASEPALTPCRAEKAVRNEFMEPLASCGHQSPEQRRKALLSGSLRPCRARCQPPVELAELAGHRLSENVAKALLSHRAPLGSCGALGTPRPRSQSGPDRLALLRVEDGGGPVMVAADAVGSAGALPLNPLPRFLGVLGAEGVELNARQSGEVEQNTGSRSR
jgi:hypothetical protein